MLPPSHSLADNVPKPGYMALTGWVNVAGTWVFPNSSPCQWAHMYLMLLRPSLISMNSWEDRYNYFLVVTSLAERHHLLISSCCFFVLGAPWDRCSPLPPPCRVHVSAVTGRCRTWNGNEICGNEQLTHHLNLPSNSKEDCCLRWSPGSQQPGWSSRSAAAEAGWLDEAACKSTGSQLLLQARVFAWCLLLEPGVLLLSGICMQLYLVRALLLLFISKPTSNWGL